MNSTRLFKVIMLGSSMVGKSTLLRRYADGKFDDTLKSTIGVEFVVKTVIRDDGSEAKLQIWDTAGQERFRAVTTAYYRDAKGIVIVYDVTNRKSFNDVTMWINEACKATNEYKVPTILVGNKTDLVHVRAIDTDEAIDLARTNEMMFMETSALNGKNVSEAFEELALMMIGIDDNVDYTIGLSGSDENGESKKRIVLMPAEGQAQATGIRKRDRDRNRDRNRDRDRADTCPC